MSRTPSAVERRRRERISAAGRARREQELEARKATMEKIGCDNLSCTDPDCMIPRGECHCSCGEHTKPAPQTDGGRGLIRGEPYLYLPNHHWRQPGRLVAARDDGARLRELLEAGGWSQNAFAKVAGVSNRLVSELCGLKGYTTLRAKAQAIADALDVDLLDPFTEELPEERRAGRSVPPTSPRQRYDGAAAKAAAAKLSTMPEKRGRLTQTEAGELLGRDPTSVPAHLTPVETLALPGLPRVTLYDEREVKAFARSRHNSGNGYLRAWVNPDVLFDRALREGRSLEDAKRLRAQAADQKARDQRLRSGTGSGAPRKTERNARWLDLFQAVRAELDEEYEERRRLDLLVPGEERPSDWKVYAAVAERDVANHPGDFAGLLLNGVLDPTLERKAADLVYQGVKALQAAPK